MKLIKFLSLVIISVSALLFLNSCEKTELEKPRPTISSLEIKDLGKTSASITANYADATKLYYRYIYSSDATKEQSLDWELMTVEAQKDTVSVDIILSDLTEASTYTFEVYANNSTENSMVKTLEFITMKTEDPRIKEVEITNIAQTSAELDIIYLESTELFYACYIDENDKEWVSIKVDSSLEAETANVSLENLVPGTEYNVEVYSINKNYTSTTSTSKFTTVAPDEPVVSSLEISEIGPKSATAYISYANSDKLKYVLYFTDSEPADEDKRWIEVSLESGKDRVGIELNELTPKTEYTFEVYSMNPYLESNVHFEEFSTPVDPANAPTLSLTAANYEGHTSMMAIASVTKTDIIRYAHYLKGQRPANDSELMWQELQVNQIAGDYELLIEELEPETGYTIEAMALHTSDETQTEAMTLDITTDKSPENITLTELKATPSFIYVTVDMEECDAFAYYGSAARYFNVETFINNINRGKANLAYSDTTFVVGTKQSPLVFNSEYKVAIAALRKVGDVYEMISPEPMVITQNTADRVVGAIGDEVGIAIKAESIGFANVTATFTRDTETTRMYFNGIVKASELNNGDVQTWIESTDWLKTARTDSFERWDSSVGSVVLKDEADESYTKLEVGTEYYIFSIAVDADGFLGKLKSEKFTTKAEAYDENITAELTLTPALTSVSVDIKFTNSVKVMYIRSLADVNGGYNYTSPESAKEKFLQGAASVWSSATGVGGEQTFKIDYLSAGTDYILYSIPVDENGNLGIMQTATFSTESIKFDSPASVVYSVASYTEGDNYGRNIEVNFNLAISGGTTQYMWATFSSYSVANSTDAEFIASYMILSAYNKKTESADMVELKATLMDKNYLVVFLPIDANGNYGTPSFYKHVVE